MSLSPVSVAVRLAVCPRFRAVCWTTCCLVAVWSSASLWAKDKPPASAEELQNYEESWQVLYIGTSRIGYSRSSMGRRKQQDQEIVVSDNEVSMTITRFKQSVKTRAVTHSEETSDGQLLSFRFEMHNPPAAPAISEGRVEGDKLRLDTQTNGKTTTKSLPWDKTIKSAAYQERLLRENPLKPGDKREFVSFDPQFGKRNSITLQAGDWEQVALLHGKKEKLLAVKVSQSVAPLISTTEYLNDQGDAVKSVVSLANMITYTVSKEEALQALTGDEVDMAVATLIKTPDLPRSAETREVVYRVSIPGEDPATSLSTGPTQKISPVSPHVVDLTVTEIRPPASAPAGTPAPAAAYLEPNTYIQSDDPLVQKHATAAVQSETDPWKQALLMEKWVAENLKQKNFSTLLASAAEVAQTMSGDCTEHAVLLAAMCRAKGIPSRVAVGLVYVPRLESFGGHMWTEVLVRGVWVPLDATLGRGGIAADHIKFADASFADDGDSAPITSFLPMVSALGKMHIEVRSIQHR